MSRALLRSVLELRTPVTRLPPSFLLPMRVLAPAHARLFNQTAQIIEPAVEPPSPSPPQQQRQQPEQVQKRLHQQHTHIHNSPRQRLPTAPAPATQPAGPVPESVRELLPLLAAQPGHYVTVHIHGRPYLVTEGDSVRLPFRMPGVEPGDVLRLNRASALGSRDFTLKGEPFVDERLFQCRAIVTGTEAEPMRVLVKKKQRCRRKTHVRSKHKYTMLRISELKVVADVAGVE